MNSNQPKPKKKHRKWPWIVLVVVLAAAALLALNMRNQLAGAYTAETAATRDLATYYSFSGNLRPVTDEIQTAKTSSRVKKLLVAEGDHVNVDDPLLRTADGQRVKAQYAGTVETLYVEEDDPFGAGSQLARIVDYDRLEVSVDVDEYDVDALAIGKQGDVTINALDKTVTGSVSEIARDATVTGGVSYYAVKLRIEPTADIRSGMSVDVRVLDQQAKNAVSIAAKALAYDDENKPYVLVKDAENRYVSRYVSLGVSDGQYTQILDGVADGETVYYAQNDMLRFYAMRQSMMSAGGSAQ